MFLKESSSYTVQLATYFYVTKSNFMYYQFVAVEMEGTLLRAKMVILGDAAVGKSSLVQVFHSESQQGFPKAYSMTTGTYDLNLFIPL